MSPANDAPAAETAPALDHIEAWAFDLDNTLYPSSCNLFAQVDVRITDYIAGHLDITADEARALQKNYFRSYGTTMRGLMTEHGVDPDHFLDYVHRIDHSPVQAAPALDDALTRIAGTKYVFTNASVAHAESVMNRLGVAHHFEDIFDIAAAAYQPKPHPDFYDGFLARHGIAPRSAVLLDDMAKNLQPAHERGMTTVWVRTDSRWS
ncbi:MAG: pyrimidine 5'-nucleotidase, partial [Methyloligellaceae bacterium]